MKAKEFEELTNLYNQLYSAMIEKNSRKLNKLLNKNFSLTHITGLVQSKEDFIKAIEDGILNYYQVKHIKKELQKINNTLYLIGDSVVEARVFGGNRGKWNLRLKIEIINKKGDLTIGKTIASVF